MDWYNGLDLLNKIYLGSAVGGGVFFLIRLLMNFIGGEFSGHDGDVSVGHSADDATGDPDASFQFLTIQGLTAFFLFSGLIGLSLREQFSAGVVGSLLGASMVGVVAMAGNAFLVKALLGLQSSGTLDMRNAAGREGTVYLTIKNGQTGQVRIEIQQRLQIFDAISDCGRDIPTGAQVWVTGFNGAALTVEPLDGGRFTLPDPQEHALIEGGSAE